MTFLRGPFSYCSTNTFKLVLESTNPSKNAFTLSLRWVVDISIQKVSFKNVGIHRFLSLYILTNQSLCCSLYFSIKHYPPTSNSSGVMESYITLCKSSLINSKLLQLHFI
ncbi:hypothetical protein Dimus_026211 [Dionaea muscipula]